MRKAVWGAILLGVFALSIASPIREVLVLHRVLGLASLGAYLLLSYDPPVAGPLQRRLLLAGIACAVATFLLAFLPLPAVVDPLVRALAVATIALPLWLVAGPVRYGFVAAAAVGLVLGLPAVGANLYVGSIHAYMAAGCAFVVAARMQNPAVLSFGERKPPRLVVASNIVTLTPEEKRRALDRLERRYRAGELSEHDYLDKQQEIESR